MERFILHVDMDAFFAAIEQRNHPEYRGKPVVVGADPKQGTGRGVVSTCSYEARQYGIHSAMPINQAYKKCPHAVYVYPNGKLYGEVSREIFKIFYKYTDLVEPLSIDEAFLDVSGSISLFGSAVKIAENIKSDIKNLHQLTASVGIAPNKYLAKIASDLEKPDGLVVVAKDRIMEFLDPLDITRLWGAGQKTVAKLKKLGIRTFGDLARFPEELLEQKFGKVGKHFFRLAHGIDDREVNISHQVKSVSNEMTFSEDVSDTEIIQKALFNLCEKVGYRLRTQHLIARTVHLKFRYQGYETHTRNHTLDYYTSETEILYGIIKKLFHKNYQKGRKIRLLGVGMSGFGNESGNQLSLFNSENEKYKNLNSVEDLIRKKFGKESITRAEGLKGK